MTQSTSTRASVIAEIAEAARIVAPLWPLGTAVAVNPLWDLRRLGFEGAIARARSVLGIDGYPSASIFESAWKEGLLTTADLDTAQAEMVTRMSKEPDSGATVRWRSVIEARDPVFGTERLDALDAEVARWVTWYIGEPVVGSEPDSFFRYWRERAPKDRGARRLLGREGAGAVEALPADPLITVAYSLEALGLDGVGRRQELMIQLGRLLGWASHAKWRSQWFHGTSHLPPLSLTDYLGVRMAYLVIMERSRVGAQSEDTTFPRHQRELLRDSLDEYARLDSLALPERLAELGLDESPLTRRQLALRAMELNYQEKLLQKLRKNRDTALSNGPRPAPRYQAVFCIDVRSEGLRRHLE
ncbi:MAG: putative inorganic carbon transporter subunit DabA, partial [Acidimicrobiales bacterium]